jgi:hypothetical protein
MDVAIAVPSVRKATGILGVFGRWGHDLGARCTSGGGRGSPDPRGVVENDEGFGPKDG